MAAPALPPFRALKALVVYGNIIHSEQIRSVSVYRWDDGYEEDEERDFIFHKDKNYEESYMGRNFTANYFNLYEHYEGRRIGVWECLLMFDIDTSPFPDLDAIPSEISITRNPKLQSIPSLADDLQDIFELRWAWENADSLCDQLQTASNDQNDPPPHLTGLDQNIIPPESGDEGSDQNGSG